MTFLTEWYPEFIKSKKDKEGKPLDVLGFGNRTSLMSLGITKNSTITQIPMEEAKKSKELILFRNAKPSNPVKVWIGYTYGDKFTIYRPSEIGAKDSIGVNGDKSPENRAKLYNADQAFRVYIEPKSKAKVEFKKENPEYWNPANNNGTIYQHYQKKYKESIKKLVDEIEKKALKEISAWEDKSELTYIELNTDIKSINKMLNDYVDTLIKEPSISGIKKLMGEK